MSKSRINMGVVRRDSLDPNILTELRSRDAALWLGPGLGAVPDQFKPLADLISLPWQCVLCEAHAAPFVQAIEDRKDDAAMVGYRGYIDVVASNPEDLRLTSRSLPVYLLNGRDQADDPQARPTLSKNQSLLRRLSMIKRLTDGRPRTLLAMSSGEAGLVESLIELWQDGFRASLIFVTPNQDEITDLEERLFRGLGIDSITVYAKLATDFVGEFSAVTRKTLQPSSLIVRTLDEEARLQLVDATACERHDAPLLDRYDLLQERDLAPLMPGDLSEEELNAFFERSTTSWRPYAAGLPWVRSEKPWSQLKTALRQSHDRGSSANRLLVIPAPSGAGGTTCLRQLAFHAATEGYPTLIARSIDFAPEHSELTGFLFSFQQERIRQRESQAGAAPTPEAETPAVIAFDANHWAGHESALGVFLKSFDRAGRSVVLLAVIEPDRVEHLSSEPTTTLDAGLSHEMSEDEAINLGRHLNRFLDSRGKGRSDNEWRNFQQAHVAPVGDFGATPASFWIALEFWLKRQLSLGESIQQWLYRQFSTAELSDVVRGVLLRIAAMTIERVGLPEELLPRTEDAAPLSLQLEAARRRVPSLGLVRSTSVSQKQWTLGHVQLARYLLNLAFRDRGLVDRLGFVNASNVIEFRLGLLRSIACNPLIAYKSHVALAVEFAKTIFKLDRDGNREFFSEWQMVLSILEAMPERLWETSRAFNHHVAISRRRVAADVEFFPLSIEEQRAQLSAAAEHLEYSLEHIDKTDDDDSDLNLLNSLARCFQDLAELEVRAGGPAERVTYWRQKATECIRRAQILNPTNGFVLETLARDLLQSAEATRVTDASRSAHAACEALTHLRQALTLESADNRRTKLNALLVRCFQLLTGAEVASEVTRLRLRGDVVGIVASAWLELLKGTEPGEIVDFKDIDNATIDSALAILGEIPTGQRSWIDLRLNYDLVTVRDPHDFGRQLDLLDAIVLESRHTDFQTQLEYAILLYQLGRGSEGSEIFRHLRHDMRESEVFVVVPPRLRFLYKKGTHDPEVCTAVVVEDRAVRSIAAVQNLKNEKIPFIPREFNRVRMGIRQRFPCVITFGPNGPFIRPAHQIGEA